MTCQSSELFGKSFPLADTFLVEQSPPPKKVFQKWMNNFLDGVQISSDFNVLHLPRARKLKTVLQYYTSKAAQSLAAKGIKWLLSQKHTTS